MIFLVLLTLDILFFMVFIEAMPSSWTPFCFACHRASIRSASSRLLSCAMDRTLGTLGEVFKEIIRYSREFLAQFVGYDLSFIEEQHNDIPNEIRETKVVSDELSEKLAAAADAFFKNFQ